jgi:hypothetical protein
MNLAPLPDEFVGLLREVPLPDRSSLILDRLRQEIAGMLDVSQAAVPPDYEFSKVRVANSSVVLAERALHLLRTAVRLSLGLRIYPGELGKKKGTRLVLDGGKVFWVG